MTSRELDDVNLVMVAFGDSPIRIEKPSDEFGYNTGMVPDYSAWYVGITAASAVREGGESVERTESRN